MNTISPDMLATMAFLRDSAPRAFQAGKVQCSGLTTLMIERTRVRVPVRV